MALIYQAKGVPADKAKALAEELIKNKDTALDALAREELGIDPTELGGSAWEAAITSFFLFAVGVANGVVVAEGFGELIQLVHKAQVVGFAVYHDQRIHFGGDGVERCFHFAAGNFHPKFRFVGFFGLATGGEGIVFVKLRVKFVYPAGQTDGRCIGRIVGGKFILQFFYSAIPLTQHL